MSRQIAMMLEKYGQLSITDSRNALKEIIQELLHGCQAPHPHNPRNLKSKL